MYLQKFSNLLKSLKYVVNIANSPPNAISMITKEYEIVRSYQL